MKTESLEIDGNQYTVREVTMEEGFPLISAGSGNLDMPGLIRLATTINGKPAAEGDISFATSMKLMPVVMKLNTFVGGAEGNG
jgi:hypothetical protein